MRCTSKCLICTDVNVDENAIGVNILRILQDTLGCDYTAKWDAGNDNTLNTIVFLLHVIQ